MNGRIYVMGGFSTPKEDTWLSSMHVYDIATDTWAPGPSITHARSDACAAAVDGKIYLAGGYDSNYTVVAVVEVFDPATNAWTDGLLLPTPRGDLKCTALDNVLYVVGGWHEAGFSAAVEAFDPATGTWSQKAPMSHPRGDLALVHLEGRLLAIGGETHNGTDTQTGSHNEVRWHARAPPVLPRQRPLEPPCSLLWTRVSVAASNTGHLHRPCDHPA
jgi:N-acetylneuraminic acid mutarotase